MRWLRVVLINFLGIVLVLVFAEGVARLVEPKVSDSSNPITLPDPELAWAPHPNGRSHGVSSEFDIETVSNALGNYDFRVPPDADGRRLSILALGDSHTAASGVSTGQTWPKVLQADLERSGVSAWVHNGGVHGYSLDQYLVRLRRMAPIVKPRVVIIGFSAATDFYDVGRTRAGDFVYGSDIGRVYFSLGDNGELVEHRELVGKRLGREDGTTPMLSLARLRSALERLALYRLFKRSELAMWLAMRLSTTDEALWPGLDTALKIDLAGEDRRRFDLASKLIGRIAEESRGVGATPMLVHIPYLAQVYDSVWQSSFGSVPGYDRDLAGKRLGDIAREYGLLYVDVYPAMRDYVARHGGEWVHYPIDAHPNVTGQRLIGNAVFDVLSACLKKNPELKPDGCR
ncbi:MAG: SGNH/GDSL hydrolase family protein [Reyranella sp.]|uniref:SGNH/GDSL hydrolase family protein n=1 Tax=Reyranella sp. TaxID=1929291 RepID=UPI003D131DCD